MRNGFMIAARKGHAKKREKGMHWLCKWDWASTPEVQEERHFPYQFW
jgi:hypothetical protein